MQAFKEATGGIVFLFLVGTHRAGIARTYDCALRLSRHSVALKMHYPPAVC